MDLSRKKTVIIVIAIVAVAVLVGVMAWTSHEGVSGPSLTQTAPSSTGGTAVTASSTGDLSVTISTSTASGARSLPATSTMWQPYTNKTVQIALSYPPGWSLGPDQPISFDNFNHQYEDNSIIPMGGAEIDIVNTKYYGSLADLIATETGGDTINGTSTVAVDGVSCTEVSYGASYATNTASSNLAVYCKDPTNGLLYKIYLSYRAGDPGGAELAATFRQFLGSIKFTE